MTKLHWTLDQIPWSQIDPSKVDPETVAVIKTASLVEYNAEDYADYLSRVFAGDSEFSALAKDWAVEEVQHGRALGRWAECVDPTWSFDDSVSRFREMFQIAHSQDSISVRGSRCGELVARCLVETGTSSYYSAIADSVQEPVLIGLCRRIAADEFRHYKLFYEHMKQYVAMEGVSRLTRLRIALGRIVEMDDDELACAFHAANGAGKPYRRELARDSYFRRAYSFYAPKHLDRSVAMIFKACGFNPQGFMFVPASRLAWSLMRTRLARLERRAA